MHSCITFLLFILISLTSALSASSPHHSPRHTRRDPVGTCLTPYTNYYDSPYTTVFFAHPDDPHFQLSISTQFTRFYPDTLTQWLAEREFTFKNATITDDDLCGWIRGDAVEVAGRRHGQIGWKRVDLPSNTNASNAGTSTFGPGGHVPTDGPIKPSRKTLEDVRVILRSNTPHADIYYFRCIMLEVVCGVLGAMLAYCMWLCWLMSRDGKKILKASTDSDIELDQIKVHGLSGSGMERMDNGHRTDAPRFDIEIAKPNAAKSSPGSIGSRLSDPPPIYMLDGAGRLAVRVRDMV